MVGGAAVVIGGMGTMTGDMGMVGGGLEMVGIIGRPQWARAGTRGVAMMGVGGVIGVMSGMLGTMTGDQRVCGGREMVGGGDGNGDRHGW